MISLSEIDTTVKRATKAVGFSWGIAEEVGKSISLLEMFGLPGLKNLNQYFKAYKGKSPITSPILKFICVPIIGCVPAFEIFSANSRAPHKFEVSQIANDLILFSLENSFPGELSIFSKIFFSVVFIFICLLFL